MGSGKENRKEFDRVSSLHKNDQIKRKLRNFSFGTKQNVFLPFCYYNGVVYSFYVIHWQTKRNARLNVIYMVDIATRP